MYWERTNTLIRQKVQPQAVSSQPAIPKRLCRVLKHNHEGVLTLSSAHFFEKVTLSQQRYC